MRADVLPVPSAPPPAMPREHVRLLATALSGSLLISLTGQFPGANIADIQGGIGASADEASWLTTVYNMALLCGVVCAPPLIAALGPRRFTAASALLFAAAALGCAGASSLTPMIALRAVQGFAAGGFGPAAFVATFMTMRGPRLPFGLALLALAILLPIALGPAASAPVEEALGWKALFLVQALAGAALAAAALLLMPSGPPAAAALRRDWASILLLCLALAASALVLAQGTRLYWLDSALIAWSTAIAAGAWAGFLVSLVRSPMPVLNVDLVAGRRFGIPIALNFLFSAGFATTTLLAPQFLAVVQGYRPLELSSLFLGAGLSQLAAFPLAWWLLQRLDARFVAFLGLLLFAFAAMLLSRSTGLSAADQFRLPMALAAAGQMLFLMTALICGGRVLTPPDGPTATILFNGSTTGGMIVGVGAASELVAERQKFHAGTLAESAAAYGPKLERAETLASGFAARLTDEAQAGLRAVASVAGSLRREALVRTFDDAFLLAALLLAATIAGLLLFQRQPPLRRSAPP